MPDLVDQWLADMAIRASGRTRYEGQEPRTDEAVAAEIIRLRAEVKLLTAVSDAAIAVFTDIAEKIVYSDSGVAWGMVHNTLAAAIDAHQNWDEAISRPTICRPVPGSVQGFEPAFRRRE